MVKRFLDWLYRQVGSIYVWGAQGEFAVNEEWIRKMETSAKNADRAIALLNKRLSEGRDVKAYDCSGLIVRFFLDNNIIQSDMTAHGLYCICEKITRETLSPGDLVFRYNGSTVHHVGAYVGGGMVIHAKGRDAGVVCENIDANGESYWNRYGRVDALMNAPENFPCVMRYAGDTFVNLRTVPTAQSSKTVIDKISHGEQVLVLSLRNDGWAELIKRCDGGLYKRGFAVSKHFKAV